MSESRLEDEIDSRFKKTSIFFKVTLNTLMSLTLVAWSKLQAFNLTMLSCIEDWLNWFAWKTTEVLKRKEFQHLIFIEYFFEWLEEYDYEFLVSDEKQDWMRFVSCEQTEY